MKYVLLAYYDEVQWNALSIDQCGEFEDACASVEDHLRLSGSLLAIDEPHHRGSRITLRVVNGTLMLCESSSGGAQGPLRQVFFLIARDLNEAVRLAARLPQARIGHIEIRSLTEFDTPGYPTGHQTSSNH